MYFQIFVHARDMVCFPIGVFFTEHIYQLRLVFTLVYMVFKRTYMR